MKKLNKTVTLPPPKTQPWFECSDDNCSNEWQAYHAKIGCLCHSCDDKTADAVKQINDVTNLLRINHGHI